MVVQIHVLSTESMELSPTLVVSTDKERFMFNVGDGIQRMCMEHRIRLSKLRHIFLTQLTVKEVGGLPGMILTISDTCEKESLNIYGPPMTQKYLHATRHFLSRPDMSLKATEIGSDKPTAEASQIIYRGEQLVVHAIPIRCKIKRKHCEISDASPSDELGQGSVRQASSVAISYVIETPPQRGKFLVDRAIALGVPKGKMFGHLHQGKSVELSDGKIVHPRDCVSPSLPGAICLLISCPTIDYIDELVSWEGWKIYQSGEETEIEKKKVLVIYHLAKEKILSDVRYVEWLQKFGDDLDHVILNHPACPDMSVFRASTQLQSQIHAEFPLLVSSNAYERKSSQECGEEYTTWMEASKWKKFRSVIIGESLLQYTLSPVGQRGLDRENCFQLIQKPEKTKAGTPIPSPNFDIPRITFLGTGCAIPSKFRNVSGIHIVLHGLQRCGGLLLDCGEGSLGQLYRAVGGNRLLLSRVISQLQCIWISHNHADHHLGVLRILSERSNLGFDDPLLIIAPNQIRYWLEEYCQIDLSIQSSFRFVDNRIFDQNDSNFDANHQTRRDTLNFLHEKLSLKSFLTIPVKHTHLSYAAVLEYGGRLSSTIESEQEENRIYKVAYSGDCRPSADLVSAAMDAFLFIHEATFDDTLQKEAKDKCHSTFTEAMQVVRNARAKHVILTHFSQRYPTISVSDSDVLNVLTAFDLLTLPLSELRQDRLLETCRKFLE
uniref:ribonuclease Z n=1 Tax=Albugo laibachii Nc14 TaxID=890382 RepID=F0W6L1_9STRA|nr:PREDICTED: similar to AGAP009743PA putative [Albugo laibachii Nc14]|eukprot:CCA16756.1 PREDICTED: similar to AGAP009743PA putative [Albugo laibachii Nc14]